MPDYDVPVETPKCDFCSGDNPAWRYPVHTFNDEKMVVDQEIKDALPQFANIPDGTYRSNYVDDRPASSLTLGGMSQ